MFQIDGPRPGLTRELAPAAVRATLQFMKSRTLFGLAGAFFLLFAAYIFLRSHNWAAAVLAGLAGAIFTLLGAMPERRR